MSDQVRDLFAIVDDKVIWDLQSTQYHISWLSRIGALGKGSFDEQERVFNTLIRGFYDGEGNLIMYKGKEFRGYGCYDAIHQFVEQFTQHDQINNETKVWAGAHFGTNDKMSGQSLIGTIEMVREANENHLRT